MYPHITENNLINRQTYHYIECESSDFFDAYKRSRTDYYNKHKLANMLQVVSFLREIETRYNTAFFPNDYRYVTSIFASAISECLENTSTCLENMNFLVKAFEVQKRFYHAYKEKLKYVDPEQYNCIEHYVVFSLLLAIISIKSNNFKYLSTLLKINDTLLSIQSQFSSDIFESLLSWSITQELRLVNQINVEIKE